MSDPKAIANYICSACGHGVAEHEWIDETHTDCLAKGYHCPNYFVRKPALREPTPPQVSVQRWICGNCKTEFESSGGGCPKCWEAHRLHFAARPVQPTPPVDPPTRRQEKESVENDPPPTSHEILDRAITEGLRFSGLESKVQKRAGMRGVLIRYARAALESRGSQEKAAWKTVIVGLPIIRKLLKGEEVTLESLKVCLIPDDVLFNNRESRGSQAPEAKK